MKQLSILILLFFILSCDKNEPKPFSEQHTEQEIFNALIGTWHPYRLAYDENFKQIELTDSCWKKYSLIFNVDSTAKAFAKCTDYRSQGTFYVKKQQRSNGQIDIKVKLQDFGILLSPIMEQVGGATLYNYTDSTLIFSEVSHIINGKSVPNLYSEFKRVK